MSANAPRLWDAMHGYDPIPVPVCICTHARGNHEHGACAVSTCHCPRWEENTAEYAHKLAAWKLRNRKEGSA